VVNQRERIACNCTRWVVVAGVRAGPWPVPHRTGWGLWRLLEGAPPISRVVEAIEKRSHLVDFGPPLSADHPLRTDGVCEFAGAIALLTTRL
jgi:hypothetical protein